MVVEAVEAKMEEDHSLTPAEAARKAMGEITAPIIAITLVLMSVFVPVAFIPGISGVLFQQFAVVVTVSMIISAINALTLSPALCGVLLKQSHGPKRFRCGRSWRASTGRATAMPAIVKRLVRMAVIGLVALAVIFPVTGWLFKTTPTGFLPAEDRAPSSARSCCRRAPP